MTEDPEGSVEGSVEGTFDRSVDDGEERLERGWPQLLATGAVGGADISFGVFALLLVEHETGDPLLAALAFGIGFIALSLGRSELFTENFLVPINALVAGRSHPLRLVRLWVFTMIPNLAAGWLLTLIIIDGFPELEDTAVEVGRYYPDLGVSWQTLAAAIVGGAIITLMTWMENSTDSAPAKLVAVVAVAFLLAAGPLNHVIVISLEAFAALHAGADFTYLDWLIAASWATLGNLIGGVGLVTLLRLVQVGKRKIEEEQVETAERDDEAPSEGSGRAAS